MNGAPLRSGSLRKHVSLVVLALATLSGCSESLGSLLAPHPDILVPPRGVLSETVVDSAASHTLAAITLRAGEVQRGSRERAWRVVFGPTLSVLADSLRSRGVDVVVEREDGELDRTDSTRFQAVMDLTDLRELRFERSFEVTSVQFRLTLNRPDLPPFWSSLVDVDTRTGEYRQYPEGMDPRQVVSDVLASFDSAGLLPN